MEKQQMKGNQDVTLDEVVDKKIEVVDEQADNMADESFENGDIEQKLTEEISIWQDKYVRLSAEFDNYRKRTLKEKMELVEYGGQDVLKSILSVVDDFDRALSAMETTKDVESVKQGVELISQKLSDVLKQKGVVEIESLGLDLDTDYHDAIAKVPSGEESKGKIIDVVEKGYKLKDKVIRFAKVVVGE